MLEIKQFILEIKQSMLEIKQSMLEIKQSMFDIKKPAVCLKIYLRQRPALTRDLATHLAAYAALRSTLV